MKRFYFFLLKTEHFYGFNAFLNKLKLKEKISDNFGKKICRLFHLLAQFLLTTSGTALQSFTRYLRQTLAFT